MWLVWSKQLQCVVECGCGFGLRCEVKVVCCSLKDERDVRDITAMAKISKEEIQAAVSSEFTMSVYIDIVDKEDIQLIGEM